MTTLEFFTAYFWRKKGEAYNPKNTLPTRRWEYCGEVLQWSGSRNLVKVERITSKEACVQILKENLTENWAWVAALSFNAATIQNILVQKYLQKIKMGAVDWPAQSPDLKSTGMI